MHWIDYGLGGLTTRALQLAPPPEGELAVLYERLAENNELLGFVATARFYEIGTAQALDQTEAFFVAEHEQRA